MGKGKPLWRESLSWGLDKVKWRELVLNPTYGEMIEVMVDAIPLDRSRKIKVIDLDVGPGLLIKNLLLSYPLAEAICIGSSEEVVNVARIELADLSFRIDFVVADIVEDGWELGLGKFDLAVCAERLNKVPDLKKIEVYRKVNRLLLDNGGILMEGGRIRSGHPLWERQYLRMRVEGVRRNIKTMIGEEVGMKDLEEIEIGFASDLASLSRIEDRMRWLREVDFSHVECIWKKGDCFVIGAIKGI
jgi:hypothetical protein